MSKLSLEKILKESVWVVKYDGWRNVGTHDELRMEGDDIRDIDLCVKQPAELQPFFDEMWKYERQHGWMTISEYYFGIYNPPQDAKMQRFMKWMSDGVHGWMKDEVNWHNKKEVFFYTGGENGKYVRCDKTGLLEVGTYEGAVQNIGDALFKRKMKKQYSSQREALERAVYSGGMAFLQGFISKAQA